MNGMQRFSEEYMAVKVPANNKRGFKVKYVYGGPLYKWDLTEEEVGGLKWKAALFLLADVCVFFMAALIRSWMNARLWVAVPGTLSLIPLIYELIGTVSVCVSKREFTEDARNDCQIKLKYSLVIRCALLLVTFAAAVYYLVLLGAEASAVLITLLLLLDGAVVFLYYRMIKKLPFYSVKNMAREKYKDSII